MFSERSKTNLEGVHLDLITVLNNAYAGIQLAGYDIIVTEGVRSGLRQAELLKVGQSTTLNSRHLTGHAFDIAVVLNGEVTWEFEHYFQVAQIIKESAKRYGYAVEWGGDWRNFKDGTHFQLSWKAYPLQPHPKTAQNSTTIAAAGAGIPVAVFVPQILETTQELIGKVTFFEDGTIKYIQFGAILVLAGYIVWERVKKNRKEGV